MPTVEQAKTNRRFENIDKVCQESGVTKETYEYVLQGIAKNVKMGPFIATSGVVLAYYLNATTNFFDPILAPKIAEVFSKVMANWLPTPMNGEKYLICGMEVAGGILAGQLAAANLEKLNRICDYVYVRKAQKETGTKQQLEGPNKFTQRNPDDPPLIGIWVDDANSTGSSLKDGIRLLKEHYNIHIKYALYLVDRFQDRANLPPEKQHYADPIFDGVEVRAIYDLQQVDRLISSK